MEACEIRILKKLSQNSYKQKKIRIYSFIGGKKFVL